MSNPNFVEREFSEYIEGEYDDEGFFNTPNGSFWDPDGVYFNKEGYDRHGGYYENGEYVPGKGWDEINNCYDDEIDDFYDMDDEYGSEQEVEDDGYGHINMEDIEDEEKYIKFDKEDIEYDGNINKNDNNYYNIKKEDKKHEEEEKIIKEKKEEDKNEKNIKESEKKDEKEENENKEEKKNKLDMLFDEMEDENKKKKKKSGKKGKIKNTKK